MLGAFSNRIRNLLIAGIVVIVPIWVTFLLLRFLINVLNGIFSPAVVRGFAYFGYTGVDIPRVLVIALGVLATAVALFLVGLVTTNLVGRQLIALGEKVLCRLPIVRTIYGGAKQLLEAVTRGKDEKFERVVLVEYPRREMYVLGFVTSETRGEVENAVQQDVVKIYIPTTPNPTSGMLIFVPRKDVLPLTMSIEDGIKLVVSGGMVTPHYKAQLTAGELRAQEEPSALSVSAAEKVGQRDVEQAPSDGG